jgi:hypothetical protein
MNSLYTRYMATALLTNKCYDSSVEFNFQCSCKNVKKAFTFWIYLGTALFILSNNFQYQIGNNVTSLAEHFLRMPK